MPYRGFGLGMAWMEFETNRADCHVMSDLALCPFDLVHHLNGLQSAAATRDELL